MSRYSAKLEKSWVEICDEELEEEEARKKQKSIDEVLNEEFSDEENQSDEKGISEPTVDENLTDENVVNQLEDKSTQEEASPAKSVENKEDDSIYNEIFGGVVENSEEKTKKDNESKSAKTIVNSPGSSLTYAQVLLGKAETKDSNKNEKTDKPKRDIPTQDLSLTSHLDVFQMDSPQKDTSENSDKQFLAIDEETMFSPIKMDLQQYKQNTKRRMTVPCSPSPSQASSLGPSPRKISKSNLQPDVHTGRLTRSKRRNANSSSSSGSSTSLKYETDPATLARRQKQIDYGKNTIGYERYIKEIPRDKREKHHPKTPPKHIHYSRRSYDGLIKSWRSRLHQWDPPGHDARLDELDAQSEVSSIGTNSTPITPEDKNICKKSSNGNFWSPEEIDLGCRPLSEENVTSS